MFFLSNIDVRAQVDVCLFIMWIVLFGLLDFCVKLNEIQILDTNQI